MWGLFSLFIFIIHFKCIFRLLEMKGGGGVTQSNLYNRIYL